MKKRILAGMGANSYGMAITIGIQLVSLPFFLQYWDATTYGTWLLLSAVPSYLAMADIGMVTAAGNKMTMAMGKGDVTEANQIFQSAQLFMGIACLGLAAVVVPLVLMAPLPGLSSVDQRMALVALSLSVLISLFGGLTDACFKSTNRYASGTIWNNSVRLGEWLGFMVGLIGVGSFTAVALAGLAVRLAGTCVAMVMAVFAQRGLSWGFNCAQRSEIRSMLRPAISFMAFPVANALSYQGMTILVGAMFGPVAVVLFNTYRTIARVAVQISAIFSHALWPEFSRLFGQSAHHALIRLFHRSYVWSAVQTLLLSITLYFLSPWILQAWARGAIEYVPVLMALMLTYAAVGGLVHVPRVLLMATNQHGAIANWSIVVSVLSIWLAWKSGTVLELNGVAAALLASEIVMAIVCSWLAYQLTVPVKKAGVAAS